MPAVVISTAGLEELLSPLGFALAVVTAIAAAFLVMGLTWGPETGASMMAPHLALLGAGFGLVTAPTSAAAVDGAPPGRRGVVSGLVIGLRTPSGEELINPLTGEPHTQHTCYPVPLMLIDEDNWQLSSGGGLSGIAPTVLQLMGFDAPAGMTAPSLLLARLFWER